MIHEGDDRVRQVDWLRQLASDTVSWAQTTLAEWIELGGDRVGYIEALAEDAVSDEMPGWFEKHDTGLLREFIANELRLTTKQAGEELGIGARRVRQLIEQGHLPATKMGRDWLIEHRHLELVKERKVGRPPKQEKD